MTIVTRSAFDVFAPTTLAGAVRGGDMGETRQWGVEMERAVSALGAAGGALIYATRASLYADLAHSANAMAWVIGDATAAFNGIYMKSGASGAGAWTRVGDLPFQVIILSISGTADALVATSPLPVPAADGAAILAFITPLANTGPVTIAINGDAAIPVLDRFGAALTPNFLIAGGAVIAVKSNGAIRTFLEADAAVAKAAAEAAAAAAAAALAAVNSALAEVDAARDVVISRLLGEGPTLPTLDPEGNPIASGARFYLKHTPADPADGEYVYRDGAWQQFGSLPDGSLRASQFPAAEDLIYLPAIRRRLRQLPDLLDYGTSSDASAAVEAFKIDAIANGYRTLFIPNGFHHFGSSISFDHGFVLLGEDKVLTTCQIEHNSNAFLWTGVSQAGGGMHNAFIKKQFGSTGGIAIYMSSGAAPGGGVPGPSPDGASFSNLTITYGSTGVWNYAMFLDGLLRNPTDGTQQGLRDVSVDRITTFGTALDAIYVRNCRALWLSRILCNGVGGVSRCSFLGNTASAQDINNGITVNGMTFGQLVLNNTNLLTGHMIPQGGFSVGGIITNSKLDVPPAYRSTITGLEMT